MVSIGAEVIFHTPSGDIIGLEKEGVIKVLGVPYAHAKRFQMPQPMSIFSQPFVAHQYACMPPQNPSPVLEKVLGLDISDSLKMEEECHQLSITIPIQENNTEKNQFPVMVWIYGGSYSSGAGDATVYQPDLMVREENVIVVAINYRLGILGFLGNSESKPANLGLFDMIAALRWIKENIGSFGGDANNITLFGQSAGGDAIAHLMIAECVENLFQKVIIQSAPLGIRNKRSRMTHDMIKQCQDINANTSLEDILKRQLALQETTRKYGLKGGMPFGVQYGYPPLPKEEEEIMLHWQKKAKKYRILIGYTRDEASLFAPFISILQTLKRIPFLGSRILRFFIKKVTDIIYRKPAQDFAKKMANEGAHIYLYEIEWCAKNDFKATHTIEIPLLFGNETVWKNTPLLSGISWEKQYKDGKILRSIWAEFARKGVIKDRKDTDGIIHYKKVK